MNNFFGSHNYRRKQVRSMKKSISFIGLAIIVATLIYHLFLANPEIIYLDVPTTETTSNATTSKNRSNTAKLTTATASTSTTNGVNLTSTQITDAAATALTTAQPESNSIKLPPPFDGEMTIIIEGGKANFSGENLQPISWENYSPLDHLGRVGVANAVLGKETMPKEKRKSIRHIRPSGWRQAMYDFIPGKSLFNRSHLIGFQLSAENDNEQNLMTGTQAFNQDEMVPFENLVADYIRETNNHVRYRVTPIFSGNERIARGIQIEAFSIEDQGDGVQFNVFIHNVQKGVVINYLNGKSELAK